MLSLTAIDGTTVDYSDRFTLVGMTGIFSEDVLVGLTSVSGTAGPPASNVTVVSINFSSSTTFTSMTSALLSISAASSSNSLFSPTLPTGSTSPVYSTAAPSSTPPTSSVTSTPLMASASQSSATATNMNSGKASSSVPAAGSMAEIIVAALAVLSSFLIAL